MIGMDTNNTFERLPGKKRRSRKLNNSEEINKYPAQRLNQN
jgi:hypothetical protein